MLARVRPRLERFGAVGFEGSGAWIAPATPSRVTLGKVLVTGPNRYWSGRFEKGLRYGRTHLGAIQRPDPFEASGPAHFPAVPR